MLLFSNWIRRNRRRGQSRHRTGRHNG